MWLVESSLIICNLRVIIIAIIYLVISFEDTVSKHRSLAISSIIRHIVQLVAIT